MDISQLIPRVDLKSVLKENEEFKMQEQLRKEKKFVAVRDFCPDLNTLLIEQIPIQTGSLLSMPLQPGIQQRSSSSLMNDEDPSGLLADEYDDFLADEFDR
jgi:hypothetical protein